MQICTAKERIKIKAENPELTKDLKGMAEALKKAWEEVPQTEKDRLQEVYDKEMEIWRPKWAAYKETFEYKDHFEVKQDWVDGRTKKKLIKKFAKEGPARAKSGYMIFAGTIRDRVKQEVADRGGGMGDIGVQISGEWGALSEAKKAEFGEQALQQKTTYDIEYAKFKTSPKFKDFCQAKAKLESGQTQKKLFRTTFNEAPKKPPSSYALFRSEVMTDVVKANRGKTSGELGKIIAEMWSKVPADKKAKLQDQALDYKEKYDIGLKEFKKAQKYTTYLEKRKVTKERENKMVNLYDMPKRPKSVFALYCEEHKTEVPQGKGEGKGRSALKKNFESADKTELEKYEETYKTGENQFKENLKEFKAGDQYKLYENNVHKIKREFLTEAMKVMTIRFLEAAPQPPPKSPFGIFLGEKRKREGDGAAPRSKAARVEELEGAKKEWNKLDKGTQGEYENTRQEKIKAFKEEAKTHMESGHWKEYMTEAKRLRIPIKSLMTDKQAVKKLKNGMRFIPLPEKPETLPKIPPKAQRLFTEEKKKEMDDLVKIGEMWKELPAEEKAKWIAQEKEKKNEYAAELAEFKKGKEGSDYLRKMKQATKTRRLVKAKFDFLKDMPKKPVGAMKVFLSKTMPQIKKSQPALKGFELKKAAEDKWKTMEADEKKKWTDEAQQKDEEFNNQMKEFRDSENWKKYQKATLFTKAKAAVQKQEKPNAPKEPENLPKPPLNAKAQFIKEQEGKSPAEVEKEWDDMDDDDKEKLEKEAKEREQKYQADKSAFDKSPEGKTYNLQLNRYKSALRRPPPMPPRPKEPSDTPKPPPGDGFKLFMAREENKGTSMADGAKAYKELDAEAKEKVEEELKEARDKFKTDKDNFDKSPSGRKYKLAVLAWEKRKRITEAKSRFLHDEPKKPENSFSIFSADTRPKIMAEDPELKGLGPVAKKLSELWNKLSPEEKKVYTDKEKALNDVYKEKLEAFRKTPDYKRYEMVANKANGVKPIFGARKASSSKGPKMVKAPDAPANMPQKPPATGLAVFTAARKEQGDNPKKINEDWIALMADGQKEFNDKCEELTTEYDKEFKKFKTSVEGKRYLRLKAHAENKNKQIQAKAKFLGAAKEPKKPQSAYFLFAAAKRASGQVSGGMAEAAKQIVELWKNITPEDKKKFEDEAKEAKQKYDTEMVQFRQSDGYKKFMAATKPAAKPAPKMATKATPKPAAKGASKPAKNNSSSSDSDVMGSDSDSSSAASDSD